MKKMRMCFPREKTFEDGFKEYILDCKARNLRDGTIHHYQESIKQIYKRIPPNTPISSMNKQTMADFYIALRDDPNLNEVSMGTYARDLKTLMRFFMKCGYIPHFEIQLPKADKAPIQTYSDDELRKLLKNLFIGGCSPERHYRNMLSGERTYSFSDTEFPCEVCPSIYPLFRTVRPSEDSGGDPVQSAVSQI